MTDIAIPKRHLHFVGDSLRYSDKILIGSCASGERAHDTINMMKIITGRKRRFRRTKAELIG